MWTLFSSFSGSHSPPRDSRMHGQQQKDYTEHETNKFFPAQSFSGLNYDCWASLESSPASTTLLADVTRKRTGRGPLETGIGPRLMNTLRFSVCFSKPLSAVPAGRAGVLRSPEQRQRAPPFGASPNCSSLSLALSLASAQQRNPQLLRPPLSTIQSGLCIFNPERSGRDEFGAE